jgi:hypothetical protein
VVSDFQVNHTGAWLFAGKFGYSSARADDLSNTGHRRRADVGWRMATSHRSARSRSTASDTTVRARHSVAGLTEHFDRRLDVLGGAEYKATDRLIWKGRQQFLTGKTGYPANFRLGSLAVLHGTNSPRIVQVTLNFTGNSRFVGWEIDLGCVHHHARPDLDPRISYADYGSAFDQNNTRRRCVLVSHYIF